MKRLDLSNAPRGTAAVALLLTIAGCGGGGTGPATPPPPPPPPPPAAVATITLSPDTTVLVPTATRQFAATVKDAAGNTLTGRTVTWGTSATAVATVSGDGLVTAVTVGLSNLTAQSEGKTATATITVKTGAGIGATGGSVTTGDGNAALTIPAGALTQSTTITITPVATPPANAGLVAGTAFDFGPDGATFAQPVTVKLKYTAAAVVGVDQTRLRLHRYKNNAWEEVAGSTVDVGTRTVTGATSSFSTYAIIALPAAPVATVAITPDSSDVAYKATSALTVATLDAGGGPLTGRTVTWTSSNNAIATVSAAGVVTGVLPGTVTITATSETKQGTARVRVVAADVSTIVGVVRQANPVPALGGAIITREGVTAIGVNGVRRFGGATQVTLNDKWHIGSNTKAFTSFLTALSIKAGKLGWNDLMTARYTQLAPLARAEFAPVTLRDLATMQSGIVGNPNFTPTGTFANQRIQVDNWAVQQPPAAARGSYYYSNIAYQILAEINGRAWGPGWEQSIRDQIWTPLGITSGGFGPTTTAGATDQPSGHSPNGGGWTICEACDNSWAAGSGKIHMSIRDWAAFVQEILKADAGQSTLLTQAEVRAMLTPSTTEGPNRSYGMGWEVFLNIDQRIVTHDGSNTYNRSRATIYLDAGVAFIGVTNAGDNTGDGGVPNAALTALITRMQQFRQNGQ